MDRSKTAFENIVWPACRDHLNGGTLMQMEGRPDQELAMQLDMKAGIDGWQLHEDGMRGIASRVQVGRAWDTFTIRKARDSGAKTEFEKRASAVTTGDWLYPTITIQAYLETWSGPALSIGISRTEEIIAFIHAGQAKTRRTSNAEFYVVPWHAMTANGYGVTTVRLQKEVPF